MTNFINKNVLVTFRNGEQIKGTVVDANEFSLLVENEADSYNVNPETDKVEVLRQPVAKVSEVAEDVVHANLKDIRKQVEKLVKWSDESTVKVMVYDFDESGEQGFDVEIHVKADEEIEYLTLNTYGQQKDAVKRSKAVLKAVKGWNLTSVDGAVNVLDSIETYSN